jgi:hypothetical protein
MSKELKTQVLIYLGTCVISVNIESISSVIGML